MRFSQFYKTRASFILPRLLFSFMALLAIYSNALYAAEQETTVTCNETLEPININYGDSTTGCGFETGADQDTFTFVGDVGDQISVRLRTLTADLDPSLQVLDSRGTVVATGSCVGRDSFNRAITCGFGVSYTLAETGSYTLVLGESGSNEAGNYILALQKIFPAISPTVLDYDVPVTDTLSPGVDVDFFEFSGNAGDQISVRLRTLTADLDPSMSLLDSQGTVVATGSCVGRDSFNRAITCGFGISYTLAETGTYTLVLGESGLDEAGDYILAVEKIFPAIAPTVLAYGEPVTDTLSPGVDVDFFQFSGTAGDQITVRLRTLTADLDPTMSLWDSNGAIVASGSCVGRDAFNRAITCSFTINYDVSQTGIYFLTLAEQGLDEAGNYEITVDCSGACTIANLPPTVANPGSQTNQEGDSIALQITADDPEGDPLIYSATGLPPGLTINAEGLISGSLDFTAQGTYDVSVFVNDGHNPDVVASFIWIITNTNRAPTLDSKPIADQTVNENDSLVVPLSASDLDGDSLTLTVDGLPAFADFTDNGDGTGSITFNPGFTDAGSYGPITVTVSDGDLSDADSFDLTVGNTNRPPEITPIDDQSMQEGETLSVPVTASDPDGDPASIVVAGLPSFGVFNDNGDGTGTIVFTPGFSDNGTYPLTINANDGGSIIALEAFTLTVTDAPPPVVTASVSSLDFGDVLVGDTAGLSFTIGNSGGSPLEVTSITSTGAPFSVLPPTSFTIEPNGFSRTVSVVFSPTAILGYTGSITISHNAGSDIVIDLSGNGIPAPGLGNIDVVDSVEFGTVYEMADSTQELVVTNNGQGLLTVNSVSIDNTRFAVAPQAGELLPRVLSPGEFLTLLAVVTPDSGDTGTSISAVLTINSDDSDAPVRTVNLSADVVATPPAMDNNTIADVRVRNINNGVFDLITLDNCANVSGEVTFTSESTSADSFQVTLTHQNGETVENTFMPAPDGGGMVIFSGINACDLPDGVIDVKAVLQRGSTFFPSTAGKPAVKHTVALNAPVLDTLPPFTLSPTIDVCGTSRASTTVMIEGGARTVSIDLDSATNSFCLTVPLRENQQNTLIATAIDNLSIEPKPIASAPPVDIVQVNPQDIVIAKAESRPLTVEEIDDLVNRGVISLDEAENFNVSMFTIVLTIGGNPQPIRISRPFVHGGPGVYFPRSGGVGPWSPGTLPPPPPPGQPGGGCRNTCITPIIIVPPDNQGPIIPGVIIIDGRIKTLKEFFQVTLVISNTSPIFDLSNVMADINLPAGLTPINAGPGLDVSAINIDSAVDTVDMGTIAPGDSGAGQFIIRGDAMGQHRIGLDFSGAITGGGLPVGVPFSGSASTTVEVLGPPELSVHVSHPSVVDGPDVELGQIYDLLVSIENVTDDRPALYTSLQLFVGGGAVLVDEYGNEIAGSGETVTFGHILPGATVEHGFRVKSLLQGEIIACQAIAAENIILTIDTGPDGTACNIANTLPANFVPLPPGDAPVVIGINPLNGQPSIPITTSVVASFTPQTACLRADTWRNLVVDFVDPNDPSKGMEILQADLDVPGTFYLEELDANDVPLHHVPVDLTAVDPPAGDTTIATLRLGLKDPLSEILLKPNTKYRATIKGGDGGVCSASSGQTMRHDFVWTFTTIGSCNALEPPSVEMVNPSDGSIDRPLDQVIELVFTNRDMGNGQDRPAQMDPQSVTNNFVDIANSTFGVYKNADIQDGDIVSATPISGTIHFSDSLDRLTFTPDDGELQPGDTIVVRLTDQIKDACGNPLQTAPAGVKLLTFQTVLPDTLPPEPPQVDPVPPLTREPTITMTGVAEPNSIVNIAGGAVITNVIADSNGAFTAQVQLLLDQSNSFTVKAIDGNGNESDAVNIDVNGDPLVTVHDGTPPELIAIAPFDAETGVPVDTRVSVEFNEPLDPASVNSETFRLLQGGTTITGTLAVDTGNPEAFTFTPTTALQFDTEYTVVMVAGGISDAIGNAIPAEITTRFRTEAEPGGPIQTIFDLYARAKDSKIDIVWTPVDGADSYNVYRSTTQGGTYQLIAEGHVTDYAVYADFGLTNGVTYYYVVRSVTNGVESLNSNEASATPVSLRTRR